MSDSTTVTAVTNSTPKTCVEVHCDCNTMWSLAQQFSYLRLADNIGELQSKLVSNYAIRARRIAATYARFYLELEEGGDTTKKGRFCWVALGAFASKTVACTLEAWQVRAQAALVTNTTKEGLGKGNFWLFCDISGWHWYYIKHPETFDQCIDSRNASNYVSAVKRQVSKLPWSTEALAKIKQLQVSPQIKKGFAKVREFEGQQSPRRKSQIQFEHLLAIADHEQGVILQPLIYDDSDFTFWLKAQRLPGINWISPGLELIFNAACSANDGVSKSVAPDDTNLENFASRMRWITKAAEQFHSLMQQRYQYMETEIQTMAGWMSMADQ